MVVGDIAEGTELLVIGAGPGGYTAAIRAAQQGKQVTIVEKEKLGGICLNHGCIPAKALIHAAGFQSDIKHWDEIGIHTDNLTVNFEEIQEWKNSAIKKLDEGVKQLLEHHGAEIIHGTARFKDNKSVRVETEHDAKTINFEECIIATGSAPVEIPGFEFSKDKVISSRELLELEEVPDEIVVIGGGYIGMEAVTKFCKFGSTVKVVEAQEQVLPAFDEELVNSIKETKACYGDEIYTSAKAKEVKYRGDRAVVVIDTEEGEKELTGDYVLVAAGRSTAPIFDGLDIDNTDVDIEDGSIKVNERMETSVSGIYAIGDAVPGPKLAHKAYREAKVVGDVVNGKNAAFDNQYIPKVVYTDPEIASVGLNPEEAREEYGEIKVGKFKFSSLGRALTTNKTTGFARVVATEDEKLVGVQIVGPRASDMVAEATLALELQAYLDDIANTIHAHPTFPEALAEAAEDAKGESVHRA